MTKNNEQFAELNALAREYEKKMARRTNDQIPALVSSKIHLVQWGEYERKNLDSLSRKLFDAAFSKGKYEKPSEFFRKEMSWVFGTIVYDRFRDAFLHAVDQVRDYPYSTSWYRRSYRSEKYGFYDERICRILTAFQDPHCLDEDLCDILSGNLPADARAYLMTRKYNRHGFVPEILAYELDQDNPKLEQIVTDIINGDSEFPTLSHELIQAIVMSHNPRMHQLLCRLLLAARLQEGLRQAICEMADYGTMEAFQAILSTILEHDLIRYSSVKRAVGTWMGLMTEETRDLDRISNKNLETASRCLSAPAYREECIQSEDSMAIHIALWSATYENLTKGCAMLDRIIETGTHHQVLTAGYFVSTLEHPLASHVAAKNVLISHREHYDILAVYLPNFLQNTSMLARNIVDNFYPPNLDDYFQSRAEAEELCNWLMEVHGSMKKKELEFSPCIFPWYAAKLKKSDLIEKAMVIAVMLGDQDRIDRLCVHIPDCDVRNRNQMFGMMTQGKKSPAVRKAIIDGLQDKSEITRSSAYERAEKLELTLAEYRQIEDMLRLRYDDLRRHAMELLMKQSDEALADCIRRLLSSSKAPMRTAGLDMVTQLSKSDNRKSVAEGCMDAVYAMENPTTQEQILIDALKPKEVKAAPEPLFTEADRYDPVVEIGDYERDCIAAFMEAFPDSKLEKQAMAGKPVNHNAIKLPASACDSAKSAQDHLKSLSDYFIAHERLTYCDLMGREVPIGTSHHDFSILDGSKRTVPHLEVWEQWRDENSVTTTDLIRMQVLLNSQKEHYGYLKRCGKYIRDIFGPGFDQKVTYRYECHCYKIIKELLNSSDGNKQFQKLGTALGIWIVRCLPEDMFLGIGGILYQPVNVEPEIVLHQITTPIEQRVGGPAGHFVSHPQIVLFLSSMGHTYSDTLAHRIPILLNIYGRSFEATKAQLKKEGKENGGLATTLVSSIFQRLHDGSVFRGDFYVNDSTYLYARHFGLISDRTLYYHLTSPGYLKGALQRVTAVCAMKPAEGDTVSSRTFSLYNSYGIRRAYNEFIPEDTPEDEQEKLVQLCRRVASRLVPMVVEAELVRGDTPTEYSACVSGIHVLSGMDTFVRILAALGKDSLDRTVYYWGSSNSKRGNLSYLLARCTPAPGDDAEKLGKRLAAMDITEKRLIEAALYSPAWIDMIGDYLNLPGFKSACYYFMAHMNEKFDDQKKAIIARFTPLDEDELNMGAFDVDWFRAAHAELGQKKFDLIYEAAKYISDGSKHTRARKFADAALGRMDVEETETAIADKRNKDLLMAYAVIPLAGEDDLIRRYLYIQQFLKESRQFGSQRAASEKRAVEAALRNLATNAGFSDTMRLTLRMETKLVEDNRELFEEKQVGDWVFRLTIDDQGTAEIISTKDGKLLKSIPAKAKKDPYVVRLQDMKKKLTEQYRRTRRMFEQAMEDGAVFTLDEMAKLYENPVVAPIVSKLVFKGDSGLGLFNGKTIVDLDGKTIESETIITAHPLHLYQSGKWREFQKHLFDNKIVQPFRQVFRELYVKTPEELGCLTSLRYAGNQIQPKKAVACLKDRRWVVDIEAGLQKIYYKDNIVATIYALADWITPADIEAPTLEHVAFYDRKTGKALKIDEIPDVIFSEVMRDVDMAVSVAHAGDVDPETSHSTVEMRAAILEFTLPLLRLANVKVEGSHAFIDGKLAEYSVHLGSGIVHQIGGTMLNVLPVHGQHRGRLFLPFVDDDPKTAEVISKVILFAEDKKLKDPTILSQISR